MVNRCTENKEYNEILTMPRRFIKSYLPNYHSIRRSGWLQILGKRLHHPALWHLHRRSVAGALGSGVFVAFIPLPSQMLIAAALSVLLRVNLPLAVAAVWITNPITIPPIFYFTNRIGAWMLDSEPLRFYFELSWAWLIHNLEIIWEPLLVGSLTVGIILGSLTYLVVIFAWRCHVILAWRKRQKRMQQKSAAVTIRNAQDKV
jgi:uncharacterized protein (DUF2062 family)